MGLVRLEYLIFEGDEKLLAKLRAKIVKVLKKEKDLSADLVGQVHLGANGHNSLIVHPHGWNGGWHSYEDTYDAIISAMYEVNNQEHQRYLKSKDDNDYQKSIYLKTFQHGDEGIKVSLEDLAERLRDGINPEIGFIDFNGKYGPTTKAVDEEFAKHMEKMGREDYERKQRRIASKMIELEELNKSKKKK
jgi:hypothetical protein